MKNSKQIDQFLIRNYENYTYWNYYKNNFGDWCIEVHTNSEEFKQRAIGVLSFLFPDFYLMRNDLAANQFIFVPTLKK